MTEEWVRDEGLPRRFRQRFNKMRLPIGIRRDGGAAEHEFDAVSDDRNTVASVKASSGRTAGNRNPSGKIKDAYAELLFLSLVKAPRRFLVLTDPSFFDIFQRGSDGKLPPGIEIVHLELPAERQERLGKATRVASREVTPSAMRSGSRVRRNSADGPAM